MKSKKFLAGAGLFLIGTGALASASVYLKHRKQRDEEYEDEIVTDNAEENIDTKCSDKVEPQQVLTKDKCKTIQSILDNLSEFNKNGKKLVLDFAGKNSEVDLLTTKYLESRGLIDSRAYSVYLE